MKINQTHGNADPLGPAFPCRKSPPAAAFSAKTRFPCSQISAFCALAAQPLYLLTPAARPGKRARKPCYARLRPLKNPWFWKEPRFLRPSDARNAHEKCCGIRLWGSAPNPGRGMIPLHPALCQQPEPCYARLPNPPHMSLDSEYRSERCGPTNLSKELFDSLRLRGSLMNHAAFFFAFSS